MQHQVQQAQMLVLLSELVQVQQVLVQGLVQVLAQGLILAQVLVWMQVLGQSRAWPQLAISRPARPASPGPATTSSPILVKRAGLSGLSGRSGLSAPCSNWPQ